MAGKYNAGSVSARVELDTSQFDEAIEKLKKQAEDIKRTVNQSAKGTEASINNLVATTNKLKEQQSELSRQFGGTTKDIKKEADALKTLSPEIKKNTRTVKETVKANDNLKKSQDKVTQSLKKQEQQAKKTSKEVSKLQKEVNKAFYNETQAVVPNGLIDFKDLWRNISKQVGKFAGRKKVEKAILDVVNEAGASLVPNKTGDLKQGIKFVTTGESYSHVDISKMKREQKTLDDVAKSAKKATEATKELEKAQLDLSGATKYTYNELMANYEQLPAKIQTALDGVSRVLYAHRKDWSDFTHEYPKDVEAWGKLIPYLNLDQLLSNKDGGALHTIGKFWTENEKYLKKYEKYVTKPSKRQEMYPKYISGNGYDLGEILEIDKMKYRIYEKMGKDGFYGTGVSFGVIEGLKSTLKELENVEIVSRKTGEAIKDLGSVETVTANKTKQITNETKQLGEATKQTITQLELEKEVLNALGSETHKYLSNLKRGRKTKGVVGTDTALWQKHRGIAGRVKLFDYERYIKHMDRLFKNVIPQELYDKQFTNFRQLYRIGEVLPFGGHGGIRGTAWTKLGQFEGLSSAEQLKEKLEQSTVEAEELNTELTTTPEKVEKIKGNVIELNQVIEYSSERVVELGKHLLENYEKLPLVLKGILQELNMINAINKKNNTYEAFTQKSKLLDIFNQKYGLNIPNATTSLDPAWYFLNNLELVLKGIKPAIWDYKKWIELTDGTTLTYEEATNKLNKQLETSSTILKDDTISVKKLGEVEEETTVKTKELTGAINQLTTAQQAIATMKEGINGRGKYGFGFIGEDAKDTRYIRNTLRALKDPTGISKIVPHDKDIRKYDNYQKDFLYKFYDEIQRLSIPKIKNFTPSSLKIPTEKDLDTWKAGKFPFGNKYLYFDYKEMEDGYKTFVKDTQTDIIKLLKDLNIEISKELSKSGKRIRVWSEELGKYQLIGSLDLSKMLDLGSSDDFQRIIDKATIYDESLLDVAESIKKVGAVEDETATKTKKLTRSTEELVEVLNRLKGTRFGIGSDALKTGFIGAGFKNLSTGEMRPLLPLIKDAEKLSEVEAKTTKETKTLADETSKSALLIVDNVKKIEKEINSATRSYKNHVINYGTYFKKLQAITGIPYTNLTHYMMGGVGLETFMDFYPVKTNFQKEKKGEKYISVPFKTWEEIQKLPVNYKNWLAYGKVRGFGIGSNQSDLDLTNQMYTYEELMEQFWKLPQHYQKMLLNIQDQIKKFNKGVIPKDFEQAGITQDSIGTIIHTNLSDSWKKRYKKRYSDRNNPSYLMKYRPIKGIPLAEGYGDISPKDVEHFYKSYDAFMKYSKRASHSLYKHNETDHHIRYRLGWKSVTKSIEETTKCLDSFVGEVPKASESVEKLTTNVKKVAEAEDNTTQSTNSLVQSLKRLNSPKRTLEDIIKDFHNLSSAEKTALTIMMELEKGWGSLDRNTIYSSRTPYIKYIGELLNLDVSNIINQMNLPATPFNELAHQLRQLYKLTDEYVEPLLQVKESEEALVGETKKVQQEMESLNVTLTATIETETKVTESLDNFANAGKKATDAEKQITEETKKLGETAQSTKNALDRLNEATAKTNKFPTYTSSDGGVGRVENINKLTKAFDKARESGEKVVSTVKLLGTSIKNIKIPKIDMEEFGEQYMPHIERLPMVINKATEEEKKFEKQTKKTGETIKRTYSYYNNIFKQLKGMDIFKDSKGNIHELDSRNLRNWSVSFLDGFARSGESIATTTKSLKTFDNTVINTANDVKVKLVGAMNAFYRMANDQQMKIPQEALDSWRKAIAEIESFERRYRVLSQRMYDLSRGRGYWQNKGKTNTGYGTTLAIQNWQTLLKQLEGYGAVNGSFMAGGKLYDLQNLVEQNKIDVFGKKGRVNVEGYSDYVARSVEITKALSNETNYLKESLVLLSEAIKLDINEFGAFEGKANKAVMAMTKMAEANERFAKKTGLSEEINRISQVLTHFGNLNTSNSEKLKQFQTRATALADTIKVLDESFRKGTLTEQQYDAEMKKVGEDFKKLQTSATQAVRELNLVDESAKKTSNSLRQGQKSVREFGSELGKGEEYANNLYRGLQKVRSIIISMKTILRMMGGLYVWQFAFDLLESAKETYMAKNEMESLLKKNSKVNTSGIRNYNKALDETVNRFQKINKYSLGETGASIGLEFNLTAQEMSKALPVIAMIQNEYVRAGRTVEEASLAVKDILQGEFMRLSRETGIGKDDLEEKYGWNGDKTDVLNLMKALEKAGKERHWDLFAEKATSLGDVLTITKSRFSELGAEIGTHAEPVLVGAFNTILDAVDGLKKGFEGLGSFGKSVFEMGGILTGVVGLSSAYLILAKNVGLVDMAHLGFKKTLATTILHLNRTDVATHGLIKTLIATSSGTDVATMSNISLKKALAGRILGVNQAIVAEKGLGEAIEAQVLKLRRGTKAYELYNVHRDATLNLEKATLLTKDKNIISAMKEGQITLTNSQRLAYWATNAKKAEVANWGLGKSLLKTATSARVLFSALKLISAVSLIAWGASIMAWTDKVKSYVDGYYNVVDNGESLISDAKADLDNTKQDLADINKQIDDYNAKGLKTVDLIRQKNTLLKDQKIAEQNVASTQKAVELAKVKSERLDKKRSSINTKHTNQLAEAYMKLGLSSDEASLKANNYYSQVTVGSYYAEKALDIYNTSLTNATNHSLAYAQSLQKQGVDQEAINRYMMDYNLIAEETAENWRKFNEGDVWAGFSALVGEFKKAWTDFTITPEFVKLSKALNEWFEWLKPSLKTIIGYLEQLGSMMIDAFSWLTSTDVGKGALTLTAIGTALGIGALKMAKWVTGAKSVGDVLRDLGGKLKDRIKDWKDYNDVSGDKKSSPDTQTDVEGKKNPNYRYKKYDSWGELGTDIKQDFMGEARRFAKVAGQIALAMGVISVAIVSLLMPALALATVGVLIKGHEGQIKAGVDGLKLLAPTVMGMLIPVIALTKVMDKWGDKLMNPKTIVSVIGGIVVGLGAVAVSIAMLIPSIWALGALGDQYKSIETQVKKGAEAMKLVAESLIYLVPFIPAMVLGVALVDAMFTALPLGATALVIVAGGIAVGMGLVAEAIWTLQAPLWAIGNIGSNFKDLSNVRQGAEALKLTAEALGYVATATVALAEITWEDLIDSIGKLIAQKLDIQLNGLTGEGGFFDQLNTFMTEFNSDDLKIEAPDPDKVSALASVGEGIDTISSAMKSVKSAMDNIPDEFKKNNKSISYDMESNTTSVQSVDVAGYFDQFKEPIKQLSSFIKEFNTNSELKIEPVDSTQLENLTKGADTITQVNNAVQQVKNAMGGVADSQWATAQSTGGVFSAIGNFLFHQTGEGTINNGQSTGSYKSSLGSSLQELENVVADLFTFQSNISSYTSSGEGADVSGATTMVTTIQTAISNLAQTLSDSLPTFEGKGNAISQSIVKGIKDGMNGLGGDISTQISTAIDDAKPTAYTYGKGLGSKIKNGFKENLKIKSVTTTEISSTLTYLDGKKTDFYNKGKALGDSLSSGYKDGQDMHSPGIIARSTREELDRVAGYFDDAIINLPQKAFTLSQNVASNMGNMFSGSGIQLPNMDSFQQALGQVIPMVGNVKTQVSTNFNEMQTNVGNSFNNIVGKTRTSLTNMQSQTTKNITGIKTSWRGMQTALIASAENIRSQTSQKINTLKDNMASFWRKIKNPELLISGSAGGHTGTIKRRFGSSTPKMHYAGGGGTISRSQKLFPSVSRSNRSPDDDIGEYLKCLLETGKPCYAGGWNFNWANNIQNRLTGWKTHFGKYHLDDFLNVGKFSNSSFPVKGRADVAKQYIFDVISSTRYDKYFDSKFGDDPVSALRAGAFNCWDGTNIVLALARAFGFSGSRMHGTWNGIGHVWASIPGLGIIDPTAIQNRGTFMATGAVNYGGGTKAPLKSSDVNTGEVHNYNGDINITINTDGKNVEVDEKRIDDRSARQIIEILGINPTTGR